ncbi:MAG: hypothetical protein ACLGIA_03105 [Actinomycetes bacterium]
MSEGLGWRTAEDATTAAGGGTLLFALALWGRRRSTPQQVALFGAATATAGAGATHAAREDGVGLGLAV